MFEPRLIVEPRLKFFIFGLLVGQGIRLDIVIKICIGQPTKNETFMTTLTCFYNTKVEFRFIYSFLNNLVKGNIFTVAGIYKCKKPKYILCSRL